MTGREGRVVFVGAGPGADDLITVRGARVIAEADVVVWASSLVPPGLVAGARPDALVVDSATASLEDLEPLYRRARDEGLLVARVHTGDPSIYGATAEQRALCDDLGLAHETIPGISAFSAAAARMDVEITVPQVSQSLVLTRLEGGRTPMPPRESVREFARHGTTMALYLSAARNRALQDELLAGGYPADTPCIVGYRVTWPDELMLRCPLGPSVSAGPTSTTVCFQSLCSFMVACRSDRGHRSISSSGQVTRYPTMQGVSAG